MAKYDREEYEKIIADNALRALEAKEKDEPKRRSLKEREDIYDEYKRKLREWKDLDSMTRGYEYSLNDYNSDSLMRWLEGEKGYKAPDEYEGQSEASKILPLLSGIAKEGEDWYSKDKKALEREARNLGYNPNTPGAMGEFLGVLSDYQTKYDRAEMLKKEQNGARYWLEKLFYPSRTQEIENAILTGEGGDEATIDKLTALDAGTGLAMSWAPSLRLGKLGKFLGNPLVNSTVDAGLQGVAEGVRQLGTENLSRTGQEAELAPVLAALGAGATRPAITTSAGGFAQQFPGKFGQDFARGVRRGARVGKPSERQDIEAAVKLYNKDLAEMVNLTKDGKSGATLVDRTGRKYDKAVKVPEMAEFFGISPNADGTYTAKEILKYYDLNPEAPKIPRAVNGKITNDYVENSIIPESDEFATLWQKVKSVPSSPKGERIKYVKDVIFGEPYMSLGKDKMSTYQSLFPAKAADLDANRAAFVLGELLGQGASELGGRVEPMVKANPINVFDRETERKRFTESYKNESWYKKLTDESKKIIDEAFKKKAE